MDRVLNLQYASSLTDLCEVNSSFDKATLKICYVGENRNGSSISKDVMEAAIKSAYNCPVVCNYIREDDDLGGHDMELVRRNDGTMYIANITQPVGVIPSESNIRFEDYDEDGVNRTYLVADVLLWKRQEAYQKIKNDGITSHSMEITVKNGEDIDGIFVIKDFEFTAFCLLGSNVEPCFEGSSLAFAKQEISAQFSQMMQELKESFSQVNPSTEDDNTPQHITNTLTEGGETNMEDEKKEPIAEEVFETKEELAATETEEVAVEEPAVEEAVVEEAAENFELASNLRKEIRHALGAVMIDEPWGPEPRYCYEDHDAEAGLVYAWDYEDWMLYGFAYALDGDKVVVDFETKKRMKYAIVDFDEGEQPSPFAPVFDLMKQKLLENGELAANYQAATESIAAKDAEIEELKKFKLEVENKKKQDERDALLAKFEDLNGNEAFEALRESSMEYELEALEEKCFAIRGRNAAVKKFSAEPAKTPKLVIEHEVAESDDKDEPYGGLVAKYKKN